MPITAQPGTRNRGDRSETMQTLANDVNELLSYIAIVRTPEMDAVREQLEGSLKAARRTLAQPIAHRRPAAGTLAACGGAIGLVLWLLHVRRA